jgi:hypothetical protein
MAVQHNPNACSMHCPHLNPLLNDDIRNEHQGSCLACKDTHGSTNSTAHSST